MSIECDKAKRMMVEELDGTLTAAEVESLRRHTEQCGACREERASVRLGLAGLSEALPHLCGEPEELHIRIPGFWARTSPGGTLGQLALAACLMIAVAAYLFVHVSGGAPPRAGDTRVTPVPVYITKAEAPGDGPQYRMLVPRQVNLTATQWEDFRRSAAQLISAQSKPSAERPFRQYPLVPIVPVSDE